MTRSIPCRDAFNKVQQRRTQHPLRSGLYKLEESKWRITRMQETLYAISEYLSGQGRYRPGSALGPCCMTFDKGFWLRKLPRLVAEMLAYEILPAIQALTGDGVPLRDVQHEHRSATNRAERLLADCDTQLHRLKHNKAMVNAELKSGHSPLYALLSDANRIASDAIGLHQWVKARQKSNRLNRA